MYYNMLLPIHTNSYVSSYFKKLFEYTKVDQVWFAYFKK